MPTNEKSDKLAEAKKLIEKISKKKSGHLVIASSYIDAIIQAASLISYERGRAEQRKEDIEKLLEAQAKKSFREGWEEQKKKDAVIVARIQAGVCSRIPSNQKTIELLDEARRKILNQL